MTGTRWWPTIREIAEDVRTNLVAGDADHALRMLIDGINHLPAIEAEDRLDEALDEPDTTGDPRWDALLAAAVRYRLHTMGVRPPSWTYKEPLEKFWWPTATWDSAAYNDLAHTPAELLRLGIFLDERAFTTA